MPEPVKRPYDNSRRLAQTRMTRARVVDAARNLFVAHGYPATTLDAIAEASNTPLPTLYRLFSSKRAVLAAVIDDTLGGDDQPVAFVDRPAVQTAMAQPDDAAMLAAFAAIARSLMDRSASILHVLATAATVDPDAAELLDEIRRQRHTGQRRIITALVDRGALTPALRPPEAADIVYLLMSPDTHRILTLERRWTSQRYERWLARSLQRLLLNTP